MRPEDERQRRQTSQTPNTQPASNLYTAITTFCTYTYGVLAVTVAAAAAPPPHLLGKEATVVRSATSKSLYISGHHLIGEIGNTVIVCDGIVDFEPESGLVYSCLGLERSASCLSRGCRSEYAEPEGVVVGISCSNVSQDY